MKDVMIIEKNIHTACEIELILLQFHMNVIHINKKSKFNNENFVNKVIIINGLYMPLYIDYLKYSIVIVYGSKPLHNIQSNFIYISYEFLLQNLTKIFTYFTNPKLKLASSALYADTIAQYLLKKLKTAPLNSTAIEIQNKTFTLNLENQKTNYIYNFMKSLNDIKWMNTTIYKSILNLLQSIIILKNDIIINITEITFTCLNYIYYLSVTYTNNLIILYTFNKNQKNNLEKNL